MADFGSPMLTSTPPLSQKAAISVPPTNGFNAIYSQQHHQQRHDEYQSHGSAPPQPQPQRQPQLHSHVETTHIPSQDLALNHTTEQQAAFAKSVSKSTPPTSSSPQQPKRQSKLHYYRPSDFNPQAPSHSNVDARNGIAQEQNFDKNGSRPEEQKLVVRLDLRKLGSATSDTGNRKKSSLRQQSKQKLGRGATVNSNGTLPIQTTLSASSWSLAKAAPEPDTFNSTQDSTSINFHNVHIPSDRTECVTSTLASGAQLPPVGRQLRPQSVTPEVKHSSSYESYHDSRSDDDEDYEDGGSQAMKRQTSGRVLRSPTSNKRTRISHQGAVKKKKVDEIAKKQRQEQIAIKKESPKKLAKDSLISKDIVSITGDERALKFNNDYCEACMGLGEFICCDSCPKAFHFSCYHPPLDPRNLPDEWLCRECHAAKNPPPPSQVGIFKQLMDNVNISNPKVFVLPAEIRSFFKGVVVGTDGEYEDASDQKSRVKRTSSTSTNGVMSQAEEESLQVQDAHGNIRLCYCCSKSAVGGRWMISCDHCPLHWHLDCLSPPMASPPPSTRKWMCPNHAEHVLPRRRKRKDAIPVQLDDPMVPNDGSIEVIPDSESTMAKGSIWDTDTSGILYRVPERSIKLSFIEKCQKLRKSIMEAKLNQLTLVESHLAESSAWRFDMLVAAVMASEYQVSSPSLKEPFGNSQNQHQNRDALQNQNHEKAPRERIQDAVLEQLTDPAERQEYLRFKSFQQYVREHGAEESMKQWLGYQERDKEDIASQGLLSL